MPNHSVSNVPVVPSDVSAGEPVFRLEGEYWTIAYAGEVLRLRDAKGLRYLADLLRHPGQEIPAVILLARGLGAGDASGAPDAGYTELDARATDRARSAVSKRLRSAVAKIAAHHPSLGYHLTACLKTGAICAYRPDPAHPIQWRA